MHRKLSRPHPARVRELAAGAREVERGGPGRLQAAKEICLLLAVKATAVGPRREIVAVRPPLADDIVVTRAHADLLRDLSRQRRPRRLALIHTPLRKLPALAVVGPLADEQLASRGLQDGRDVRAVLFPHPPIVSGAGRGRKRAACCQAAADG